MNKFKPKSPDPYIRKSEDMELAKFGHLNALVDVFTQQAQSQTGLVALAGGGQSGATLLIPGFNLFNTVATAGDSSILPSLVALCACTPCGPIAPVVVKNSGADDLDIYPAVGETINGGSVNVPVTIIAGTSITLKNTSCTNWESY